jgi:D-glycero-D-manno-heptose 1,7-bisphosphate phosphatase
LRLIAKQTNWLIEVMQLKNKRAVFLDRDGTLIVEKEYLHKPEEVELAEGAVEGLQRIQQAGFLLIIVTNQSGVGRGYFTMEDVEKVHAHLNGLLGKHGIRIAKTYVAPEHPDHPSRGRKPSPQFLLDSQQEFGIELGRSYMVGDKFIDLQCGWNAGVRKSILVRTGYGEKTSKKEDCSNAVVVANLAEAADWILQD